MSAVSAPAGPDDPAATAAELKAALLLRLRAKGIRAVAVLRAMELVPRDTFVPRRYLDWAAKDIALPIGCGQTTAEPSFVATAIEALGCAPDSRVLEIGSGSGFVTALLARLAGRVVGVERYRGLAEAAQARLAAQGIAEASVAWGDGLAAPAGEATFDRIIVHAALDAPPAGLFDRLAAHGVILYPLRLDGEGRQDLMRAVRTPEGEMRQQRVCAARLQAAMTGRALSL